ncbi:MAG: hypothetical protein WBG17_05295 [Burkholderiaceae bacterium]
MYFCSQHAVFRQHPHFTDQRLQGFARGRYVVDGFQLGNQSLIDFLGARQQLRRLELLDRLQLLLGRGRLALGFFQYGLGGGGDDAGLDGRHQVVEFLLRGGQASTCVGRVRLGQLQQIARFGFEGAVGVFGKQGFLHAGQQHALDRGALDLQAVAADRGAAILVRGAAVVVAALDDEGTAAAAALQQAGEQVLRGAAAWSLARVALAGGVALGGARAGFAGAPGVVVDDLQLG